MLAAPNKMEYHKNGGFYTQGAMKFNSCIIKIWLIWQ